jgi:site-specific DNA-adenine methylase
MQGKIVFEWENAGQVYIKHGDARKLDFIPDESIDFIYIHPPYADIIKYSDDINGDLSHWGVNEFLVQM